ncbi:MAG: DUF4138 domain-containing protein [Puia sp.]|nr:DUF4138 domain-containing protein [Puia sp.]
MKKLLCVLVMFCGLVIAYQQAVSQPVNTFSLSAIGAQKLGVSLNKMTNLIFPYAIRIGVKVTKDILVQKVKGVENVIEIKAAKKDFVPTNLSIFGYDGQLYSFDLQYDENPTAFNFQINAPRGQQSTQQEAPTSLIMVSGFPVPPSQLEAASDTLARMGFLHHSVRNEKMKLTLRGVYLKDSLLWIVCHVTNGSFIPYEEEYFRVFSTDRKRIKRSAIQETSFTPVFGPLLSAIPGGGDKYYAVGFQPFTISKDKSLYLELAEHNGGRKILLRISHKTLLRARDLNK